MKKINVGIIGCGRISDLHAPGYKDHPFARIYAVCDINRETAEARKREWGATIATTDYTELLKDSELDAVEILSPQLLHEQMAVAAAAAGKHIALQKPMTIDLKSADRILAAVRRAGVIFRVTDNYLFYPPIVRAKQMIDAGEIGTPTNLRIKLITGSSGGWEVPPASWEWRLAENAAGRGFEVFDHGHHLWTTAWFLLGDFERVTAWVDSIDGLIDSPATIMWKYRKKTRYGMCEFAHCSNMEIPSHYYSNDEWIEITGSQGILYIPRCTGNMNQGPGLRLFKHGKWTDYSDMETDWAQGFMGATQNFISAIRGEASPLLTGSQARDILRFSLSIARSSTQRREVYMDEMESTFPQLYTWRQKKRENRAQRKSFFERFNLGRNEKQYADKAHELTRNMVNRFNPEAVKGWEEIIGLHLLAQGSVKEARFGLFIKNGTASLTQGELPENAGLVLKVPAGTWAAILMGKKRIETALIQGRLKLEGRAELGLKLRQAFNI